MNSDLACKHPWATGEPCHACHPETAAPRFFIDHGVVHDRLTGKHVRTGGNVEGSGEDGIEACCRLLNALARDATVCMKCRTPHDGSQWATCEYCSVARTRKLGELEAERDAYRAALADMVAGLLGAREKAVGVLRTGAA